MSSSISVAISTTHHAADFGAQRIVALRILDGNIERPGLLSLCEAALSTIGLHAAAAIRFAGTSATRTAFEASRAPCSARAVMTAAVLLVALEPDGALAA